MGKKPTRPTNYVPKVGDRVRIRQWDDMAAEFRVQPGLGNIRAFMPRMAPLCGCDATVSGIGYGAVTLTDWCSRARRLDTQWAFCDYMLEPAKPLTKAQLAKQKREEAAKERRAKAAQARALAKLKPEARRQARYLLAHPDAFGCQRGHVLALLGLGEVCK